MSCGISFLSENLTDNAIVTLSLGTENAQFPLSNLKNDATAVKFRSLENDVVIVFDLQQTRTIDTVALHGDTNGTLGMTTASIRTSLTTDFSGSVVTPVTLSAENLMGYEYLTDSVSARYLELTLSGTGSYVDVSNVFIGERVNLLQQNISISSFKYGFKDNSSVSENDYSQKFIDKRNLIKLLGGSIEHCIKSEQETLDSLFLRHGINKPLWMIIDKESAGMNDGQYKLTVYGYLTKVPIWKAGGGQTYNANIDIQQAG